MYGQPRSPSWHRDVLWAAALVTLIATMVAVTAFAWSRLADEVRGPRAIAEALRVTLVPNDVASTALNVRDDAFSVDGPFEVLAGSGVQVDPTEVSTFDADAAIDRIAGVWSGRLVDGGRDAVLSEVSDPTLSAQLARALDGPAPALMEAELAEEMLPSGLTDGSRLANWELQAQQSPGDEVQPVVGMFVFVDPGELQGMSDRQIGVRVVSGLSEVVMTEGADAARDAVTNQNLTARLEQGLTQGRADLHDLFETLLTPRRAALEARLDEARALLADTASAPQGLAGLLPEGELAGLSQEAANARVLEALAERTWQDGPGALASLLQNDPRAERLDSARPVVAAFTRGARNGALRVAYAAAAVAVLAGLVAALLARGAGRVARPGIAVVLGAAPGSWLAWTAQRHELGTGDVSVPPTVIGGGAFGAMEGLLRYLATAVPDGAIAAVLRVHLVAAAIGAALLLMAVIVLASRAVRPRRRSYL